MGSKITDGKEGLYKVQSNFVKTIKVYRKKYLKAEGAYFLTLHTKRKNTLEQTRTP